MKYKCPCCGFYTFEEKPSFYTFREHSISNYDICPVCYWEDDLSAYDNPNEACSCNKVSLNQARINFAAFGACVKDMKRYTRQPKDDEKSGIEL